MSKQNKIPTPHLRVLKALSKDNDLPRSKLNGKAGFSDGSGTLNVALNGRKKNDYGNGIKGLLDLGYVSRKEVDVDGVTDSIYHLTAAGAKALERYLAEHSKLPSIRDKSACVNTRYSGKPAKKFAAKPKAAKKAKRKDADRKAKASTKSTQPVKKAEAKPEAQTTVPAAAA